jgi:hypothetical protein
VLRLLLAILFLGQAGAPAQAPGLEVAVQGRAIPLPAVPDSIEAARSGQARIRPALAAAIAELERDLQVLYGQGGADPAPVIRLSLPVPEEVLILERLLEDPEHGQLRRTVFEHWNAWQTALLQCGLEDGLEGSAIIAQMSLQAFPHNELRTRLLLPREAAPGPQPASVGRSPNIEFLSIGRMNYSVLSPLGRRARKLALPHARKLAQAWTALAEHLNLRALEYLNLDRDPAGAVDPALRALRLRAKINFLERFRSTLWFCDLIWAHMASAALPPPLATLRPPDQGAKVK